MHKAFEYATRTLPRVPLILRMTQWLRKEGAETLTELRNLVLNILDIVIKTSGRPINGRALAYTIMDELENLFDIEEATGEILPASFNHTKVLRVITKHLTAHLIFERKSTR